MGSISKFKAYTFADLTTYQNQIKTIPDTPEKATGNSEAQTAVTTFNSWSDSTDPKGL